MRRLVLLGAFALLAGCDPGTSERWLLEELRILGVKAEPAEAAPGTEVSLTSLVVDPKGGGFRTPAVTWAVCTPDPVLGEASCGQPGRTVPLAVGSAATLSVAAGALDGLTPEQARYGIDLYVFLAAQAPAVSGIDGEDAEVAVKRVRVSTDPSPNRNPRVAWFGPAGGAPEDGEKTLLQAAATDDSLEEFEGPLGPDLELLRFSWYVTAGALERGVTLGDPLASELEWKAELPATTYVVLRDDRGGMDWVQRTHGAP